MESREEEVEVEKAMSEKNDGTHKRGRKDGGRHSKRKTDGGEEEDQVNLCCFSISREKVSGCMCLYAGVFGWRQQHVVPLLQNSVAIFSPFCLSVKRPEWIIERRCKDISTLQKKWSVGSVAQHLTSPPPTPSHVDTRYRAVHSSMSRP